MIKKYNDYINEEIDQSIIDNILDKINKNGYDKLTNDDKELLKKYSNSNEYICKINELIENLYNGFVSIVELDSEPIIYKKINNSIHLIENFSYDLVGINVYGGDGYNTYIDSYDIEYSDLESKYIDNIFKILSDNK